jgi:hypothetical protein
MALRVLEGFESFGASAVTGTTLQDAVIAKWGVASTTYSTPDCDLVAGWGSGLAFRCRYASSAVRNYVNFTLDEQDTWIVGFAVYIPSEIDYTSSFVRVRKLTSNQCWLGITPNGQLYFSAGTYLWASRNLKLNTWYYLEFKVYIHASAGTVDVHVNGQSEISLTGLDTQALSGDAIADNIQFNLNHSVGLLYDDIYICDGTAGVNSFLGPSKVESLRPDTDDTVAWTPSTGVDNYALLAEQAPTITTYVEGDTITESDLYAYEALSVITGDIAGIQLNTGVALDAAGARQLDDRVYSGTTNSNGAGVSVVDTAGEIITRIIEQDPDTAANWIVAGIDGIKAGVIVGD